MHIRHHFWSGAWQFLPFVPSGFQEGQKLFGVNLLKDFGGHHVGFGGRQAQTLKSGQKQARAVSLLGVAGNLAQRDTELRVMRLCPLCIEALHSSTVSCCLRMVSVTRSLATPIW